MTASLYYYTARNPEGLAVSGALAAQSYAEALASLRTRALFVTSLTSARSAGGMLRARFTFGAVRKGSLAALFRTIATLISAGVPIRRALEVGAKQCTDARLKEALGAVGADVESGMPLSLALSKRPKEFAPFVVAMIRAGETGGVLEEILERLATVTERDRANAKRLSSALTYPALVAATAVVLIVFLLSSIVPMFASLYAQLHVELPSATAALLAVGENARDPRSWMSAALIAGAAVTIAGLAMRTPSGRALTERAMLRIPIVGAILRKATVARLVRTAGSLLKSGVGIVTAIEVAADVVGNHAYVTNLRDVRQALREGDSLAQPLSSSQLYDPLVIQMIAVGEETGTLDAMLLRIAEYYELDVETALSALGSTLEPALIVVLGGVVGFIVFSIFIPLYTLIGSIK